MYFTYMCAYVFYFLFLGGTPGMLPKVGRKAEQVFPTSLKGIVGTSTNSEVTEGTVLYMGGQCCIQSSTSSLMIQKMVRVYTQQGCL